MALEDHFEDIKRWVELGESYSEISTRLQALGVHRGASSANVKRFCLDQEINPGRLRKSDEEVAHAVNEAVNEVGLTNVKHGPW